MVFKKQIDHTVTGTVILPVPAQLVEPISTFLGIMQQILDLSSGCCVCFRRDVSVPLHFLLDFLKSSFCLDSSARANHLQL